MACLFKQMQVILPILFRPRTEIVEIFPSIKSGIVAVVKYKLHRVISNRLDGRNPYIFFVDL